ncbi:MAG: YdcF family protein [Pseudolabrys sp.]|nr:YdcF family protein [Pseudolabrys sp.]MBV9954922.1 YdcF family protein [Pseudolabrys sp.]
MIAGLARLIGFFTIIAVVSSIVVLTAGFFWFVAQISDEEVRLSEKADGIVVLTGAATRIPDAISLLTSDYGKRVLITGVHRTTSAREIARLSALNERVFACCVDLDRSALNTLGNALETRRWVRERGFNSIIVVTSSWHMPRAMVELTHQLPETKLIAFPVVSEKIRSEPWLTNPEISKLLLSEYLKYVFALVRIRLDPDLA